MTRICFLLGLFHNMYRKMGWRHLQDMVFHNTYKNVVFNPLEMVLAHDLVLLAYMGSICHTNQYFGR